MKTALALIGALDEVSTVSDPDVPQDLAQWGLHAFALGARSTPHAAVAMDDNGVVLFHARHGTTIGRLHERGIEPLQSQLALLNAYGLISMDGERLTTAFPVIGPDILRPLRSRVRQLAAALVLEIKGDVDAITAELKQRGYPGHGFAVLFGHAVDGLLWDRLRAQGLAPATDLSVERPYWNGAFWAIYPAVDGAAGVNELGGDDATLVMVWTDRTAHALRAFSRSEAAQSLLRDPIAQDELPVVFVDDRDAIHHSSETIAAAIAETLRTDRSTDEFFASLPHVDRHQRIVIVAHELIWALIESVVSQGHVEYPPGMRRDQPDIRSVAEQMLIRVH